MYEFPSREAARSWYDSAAYREVLQHRKKGAKYLVVLAEAECRRSSNGRRKPKSLAQQRPRPTLTTFQREAHRDQRDQRWSLFA